VSYDPAIEITTCHRCGTVAAPPTTSVPFGWSTSTVDGRVHALCERCTREHVWDIEGKLDETWWA